MRRLALLLVVLATAGCAAQARQLPVPTAPPPTPESARPPASAPESPPEGEGVLPPAGPITAPWDTAGSAAGKAARRVHVYPSGASAVGRKLVDSLPDPASLAPGAQDGEPAPSARRSAVAPATPAPIKPQPLPVNDRACWEVQVLVTTSESRAKDEVRRIEKTLNLAAWVRSDGAIHRVRVGGCLTADGAAELANRLHLEGYPEAFRALREP